MKRESYIHSDARPAARLLLRAQRACVQSCLFSNQLIFLLSETQKRSSKSNEKRIFE